MDATSNIAETALRTLFRRCLQCPGTTPSCPTCKSDEICSLVPTTCTSCAYNTCIRNPSPPVTSRGPNIGAIAGGVVGGVAAVAIMVFLVWRFWIKKRREQQERELEEEWEDDIAAQKNRDGGAMNGFQAMRTGDAVSTRTRGSLANSILSRASNIIQIAYIPGVTNRHLGSGTNSLLASVPVPPIPAAQRQGSQPPKSPLSNEGDMLFFRPSDIRDSTSSLDSATPGNRDTQYTRHSITSSLARSSMVSDGFRDSRVDYGPMPVTASVARAAPRMVSIKSSGSGGSSETSSAVGVESQDFASGSPALGKGKGVQVMMPGEGISPASSMRGKARQVTVGSGSRLAPVRQASDASTLTVASGKSKHAPVFSSPLAALGATGEADDDDEPEHARARQSLINTTDPPPPAIQSKESPFFDATESPPSASASGPNPYASMGKSIAGHSGTRAARGNPLSDIIEEGMKRASRVPSHEGLGGVRDSSPFGDENEVGEK